MKRALRILIACTLVATTIAGLAPRASASDDPYAARQWALRDVRAEKAWATGRGKGVVIAVVDSGVDLHHEDLKGAIVRGHDFVDGDDVPSDAFWHGTHVAGIAAARANNKIGIAGVAPDAKIMPVRVLDSTGSGSGSNVNAGIRWAADHGAKVINVSIGDSLGLLHMLGSGFSQALTYAWSKGAVPVVSAGNGNGSARPELFSLKALVVTSVGPDNRKAGYSNTLGHQRWGIAAPGGTDVDGKRSEVYSTVWSKNGKTHYGWGMGTSMAAPHVAGAAAILMGLGLSNQQTVDRLLATAHDLGTPGYDAAYGAGLVDVAKAVAGLKKR